MKRGPIKPLPSQEELQKLFSYDPLTGILTWKHQAWQSPQFNGKYAGKIAGTVHEGYIVVGWRSEGEPRTVYYLAHRLIWKLVTGEEPDEFIDHRDTDKLNNRWVNFRPATNGQNIQNSKLRKDNKTGVKGVTWEESHKAYRAIITANGVHHRLGRFKKISNAEMAINKARAQIHGEFARLG